MNSTFDLGPWSQARLNQVEQALDAWVTADAPQGVDHGAPAALVEAMRYAVLDGNELFHACRLPFAEMTPSPARDVMAFRQTVLAAVGSPSKRRYPS